MHLHARASCGWSIFPQGQSSIVDEKLEKWWIMNTTSWRETRVVYFSISCWSPEETRTWGKKTEAAVRQGNPTSKAVPMIETQILGLKKKHQNQKIVVFCRCFTGKPMGFWPCPMCFIDVSSGNQWFFGGFMEKSHRNFEVVPKSSDCWVSISEPWSPGTCCWVAKLDELPSGDD